MTNSLEVIAPEKAPGMEPATVVQLISRSIELDDAVMAAIGKKQQLKV